MTAPQTRAESLTVRDLLSRAARGELRLPRFQRGLKWKLKDNLLLLDSVYRGYPIGTLLLWETRQPAERIFLGPVAIDAPESHRSWLIVDGQQRITALAASMLRTDGAVDDYAIGFDLAKERFVHLGGDAASVVPLPVLASPERLLSWLERSEIRSTMPDASERAFRASTRLRDYEIAAYVVETEDEAMVREVFDRLNTGGKRLSKTEVFSAIDQPEGSAHGIRQTQDALASLKFGRLDDDIILKSLQAVLGEDVTQPFRPRWSRAERELAFEKTVAALKQTIVFLRRDAHVPHSTLLPYSLPVALLARFFSLHGDLHPRYRNLLARWVWRGFVHGTHQGQSIPLVRKAVFAISTDAEASVRALLALVPNEPADAALAHKVNLKTARTRIEVLVLLRAQPRSFVTGDVIDVVSVLERAGPGKLLAELAPGVSKGIANRVVVEGARPKRWDTLPPSVLEPVLRSQYLAQVQDVALAVEQRDVAIFEQLPTILNDWMGWRLSDRPPISSLIVEDDDG